MFNVERAQLVSACLGFTGGATTACAQRAGWLLEGPSVVTRANPEITIDMYVWFDYIPGVAEGFGSTTFSVRATGPEFTTWETFPPILFGEPIAPVQPTQMGPDYFVQFHWPKIQQFGNPDNPILVYRAHWRTDDFTPRWVTLTTQTLSMAVYDDWKNGFSGRYIEDPVEGELRIRVVPEACYADCDTSTGIEVLDIFDFLCFLNRYDAATPYACDCDTSTGPLVCDIFDFLCFQTEFGAGCP